MTEEKKITNEDLNLIFKGIRPEGMEYSEFKEYRSLMKRQLRDNLRGRWFFVASTPELKDDIPTGRQLTQTYKK